MRKPFLFFLIFISLYCWLTDSIGLLFYALHINNANSHSYASAGSCLLLAIALLLLAYLPRTRQVFRNWLKNVFQTNTKQEWLLLLLVAAPVILLGLFRSLLPDQNFDTYHFELYLQDYNLGENKVNFGAAAIRSYYFPLPERVYALFRHTLGFRLGTLFNTLLLVTILASAYDFIMKFLSLYEKGRKHKVIVLALLALFAILADNTFFIIGSYKPDLIGIPLLLELLSMALLDDPATNKIGRYLYFFLLASLTITFKLTFLPYVGIFCLFYFIRNFKNFPVVQRFAIPVVVLLFPSVYMAYNYAETGNPLFPFFNSIFHSPLYPLENFKDNRWGYRKAYEIFIFPVVTLLDKSRTNEWALYSYRLLFGYFISLGTIGYYLFQRRKHVSNPYILHLFYLSLLAVALDYACLVTTGYYRYGVIVEVMYGLIIVLWILYPPIKSIAVLFVATGLFQLCTTVNNIFIKNINLSWHDYPALLHNAPTRNSNINKLFSDYDSTVDNSHILPQVDAFLSSEPFPFDGLAKQLNKNVPIYDLLHYGRTPDSIKAFEQNVVRPLSQTKNVFVVATGESLTNGIFQKLNSKGFLVNTMIDVYPRFMLPGEPLYLLQVKYIDTSAITIKSSLHYLSEENKPDSSRDFSYKTGNKLKVFIREAPYVFNWPLPEKYEVNINGLQYSTSNRFNGKKTFTIESDSLKLHKTEIIPYMVIIQELVQHK